MADPEPPRESRGLALSGYEAKLVVAALCRYARASDVHPAHRDSCERLAGTVAAASSATLELRPGPTVATAGTEDAVSPAVGGTVDSKVGGARRPEPGRAAAPDPGGTRPEDATEDPFRWGPDRADG